MCLFRVALVTVREQLVVQGWALVERMIIQQVEQMETGGARRAAEHQVEAGNS